MNKKPVLLEKGMKRTPENIEAAIRARYPSLINDDWPVQTEDIGYDNGDGFSKDVGDRGPNRAEWGRDFVVDVLKYADDNGCSRAKAIKAMHQQYSEDGHHLELDSRKRVFMRYHKAMRINNFCLAVLNNDVERAVAEAMASRSVQSRFLMDQSNKA